MNIYAGSQATLLFPQVVSAGIQRRGGLRGLMGVAPIPIQLTVNRSIMPTGSASTFRIVGAPPNRPILWSSYKNGQSTGELNASYGDVTENNGTAEITFTPDESMVGNWVKEVLVQDAEGKNYTAMVSFQVQPQAVGQLPALDSGGGMLDDFLNGGFYLGSIRISYPLALAGVAGLYFFTKGRR